MRLRNVKNASDIVNKCKYTIQHPEDYKGHFSEVFENDYPICVEIGMGKGDFLIGEASRHPENNYIGIEMYESVLVRAIQKLENLDLPNVRVIAMDAGKIEEVFSNEITCLYLNFSDPWPKKRHAKRRLTSPIFLNKYESIFSGNPHIIQKTDNKGLFAYSLSSLSKAGYVLENVSLDLANEDIESTITEYETKFRSLGVTINYLEAVKQRKK